MRTVADAVAWLDSHINLEATAGKVEGLSLAKMRDLAVLLGDPHTDYPCIHVTGTNGKGSTSAMITALLVASGLTVGTYASPHVSRINERIQRNGEPIVDDDLVEVLSHLRAVEAALAHKPSWFELMTGAAFRWFADIAVDVAVVEVGKLGRYDATNIIDAPVAVVTNIAKDHTDGAPGWERAVAGEKAGIIGAGATLCLGETNPALFDLWDAQEPGQILRRDRDFACVDNRLAVGGRLVDLRVPGRSLDEVFVAMHGAHQGDNAALALTAAEAFVGAPLPSEMVAEGFASVQVPGRFEVLHREPLVVVDTAHNPHGAAVAADTFAEGFAAGGRRVLVIGHLDERDPLEMLTAVRANSFDRVVCTRPASPRAVDPADLARVASSLGIDADVVPDPIDAVDHVLFDAEDTDAVLVTGSVYLVGVVRDELLAAPR